MFELKIESAGPSELGDVRAEAWCRLLRGDAYNRELMLARAAGELSQAITLFSATDDPEGTAISLWRKGSVWCPDTISIALEESEILKD